MKHSTLISLVGGVILTTSHLKATNKTNIIVMIADDISMSDWSCYGHPVIKTPHIDGLARQGVRFTNMFLTASSSSPSRASIITGRYPHNTGACELHSPIGEEQVSIAEVLKKSGYYTAQAGKWHFGSSPSIPQGALLRAFDRTGGSSENGGGESGAEQWVNYLKERPKEKPFFMWFAAHDAHRAWDNDQSLDRYKPEEVVLPPFFIDNTPTREDFASYYYEVARFDHSVGLVIEELKRQKIDDRTMIILMADNGRPFPRAKTRLICEGIKTPFVVYDPSPSAAKGSVCNSLVSTIDIAPTLAAVAQVSPSSTFQGRNFQSLLQNPRQHFRNYVFAEHNWHDYEAYERMICTGSYLLIENKRPQMSAEGAIDCMGGGAGQSLKKAYREGGLTPAQADLFTTPRAQIELYHLSQDPLQENNIAEKEPQTVRRLLSTLHQWQMETSDSCPNEITHDWYSRETLLKLPEYNIRKEMPGSSLDAKTCKKSGPF